MDNSNLIVKKREVVITTNTAGWSIVVDLANRVVADMERRAIDEDDDVRGNVLRRQAKAAREFLTTFLNSIEMFRSTEVEAPVDEFITYSD